MRMTTRVVEILKAPFIRRRHRDAQEEEVNVLDIAVRQQKVFRYETLAAATRDFSPKNKLGEGGFGPVYKGQLKDGRMVAVKRLSSYSRQGEREFINEAALLSRVQHRNVVTLYGYCAHADDKLLVYEYVLHESLDRLLFSRERSIGSALFDWQRRYDVMLGMARGLLYLHEDTVIPIIHRDIKASNILIDERWCPKIADFGMARLFPEDHTHVRTCVAGTNGYMAPEYLMHGHLSKKVDIFSFGVVVMELIYGQKNSTFVPCTDASTLLEWAWKLHKRGQTMEMLDPALRPTADAKQVAMCVHLGLLCVQADPKRRPDMRRVVVVLLKRPGLLEEPAKPTFLWSRGRSSSSTSGAGTWASTSASATRSDNTDTASF